MNMVRHDHPGVQVKPLVRVKLDRPGNDRRDFSPAHPAIAVAGIKIFVHARGIPTEQFLLFLPGERTFGGLGLGHDGIAFRLETEQNILRQSSRQTKGDEVGSALAFEMRQHAARVKSGHERIIARWRTSWFHERDDGFAQNRRQVCGFWRLSSRQFPDLPVPNKETRDRNVP